MKKAISLILTLALALMSCAVLTVSAVTAADTKVVSVDGAEKTLAEFAAEAATSDFEGKTLNLLCDVVLSGEWTSIPSFKGTLDGNGKSITGLTAPLFTEIDGATVKNLTLNGTMTVSESTLVYALIAVTSKGNVTFENCVNNVDLTFTATGTSGDMKLGVFVGEAKGAVTLTECVNNGDVVYISNNRVGCYVGGMIGYSNAGESVEYVFTKCQNNGDVSASVMNAAKTQSKTSLVGGFAGNIGATTTFNKCVNTGTVRIGADVTVADGGHKVGGFGGALSKMITITSSVNYGDVIAFRYAGGFVGQIDSKSAISNCYNYGNVTSGGHTGTDTHSYAGGLVAYLNTGNGTTVVASANYGAITANANKKTDIAAGGIIGAAVNPADLDCCSNYGAIVSAQRAGGLVGLIDKADKAFAVTNSFVNASVTNTATPVTDAVVGGLIGKISAGNVTAAGSKFVKAGNLQAFTGTVTDEAGTVYTVDDAAAWKALEAITFKGIQYTAAVNGKFNLRLVSGLNSLDWLNAGYEVIRVVDGEVGAIDVEIKTVYKSLTGYDENGTKSEYTAQSLNTEFFAALAIENVPATGNVTFIVRPYVVNTDGTETVWGDSFTLAFANGELVK